jgi:hypothetical protein
MIYQGNELRVMRESLAIALDAMLEQEKRLDRREITARRRIARNIEDTSALLVKVREQIKRYVEED